MNNLKSIIFFIAVLTFGCSKNEPPSSNSSLLTNNNSSIPTLCSAITAKATVTSNGVSYKINALGGSGNSIGIEVINTTGPFTSSYSMQLLEVSDGNACATSTTLTESLPGFGNFF